MRTNHRRQPVKRYSDTRYTELFSNPVFVQRLLEFFVDEDFTKELDFSSLEPYKTKFVTESYARRESDVIWKVKFRGHDIYLFLLIEFQSTVDRRMPIRLLRYVAELYDSLPSSRGLRYPAVFPLVLYNGSDRWTARRNISDLIEASIPVAYIPSFHYYVVEERSFSAQTLLGMRNLVSLLFYAETVSLDDLALSMDTFFDILKVEDADAVRTFGHWLNDYFRQMSHTMIGAEISDLRSGEESTMLAENFRIWRDKVYAEGKDDGFEKGLQNGIEKGERASTRKFALKMISHGLSIKDVATAAEMTVEDLKKLIE